MNRTPQANLAFVAIALLALGLPAESFGNPTASLPVRGKYLPWKNTPAASRAPMNPLVFAEAARAGLPRLDTKAPHFQSQRSWDDFVARLRGGEGAEPVKGLAEWSGLAELNRDAERIWGEMLACNGGDPELARGNYYRDTVCADPSKAAQVRERVVAFHRDLENFLRTSLFQLPKAKRRAAAQRGGMTTVWGLYCTSHGVSCDQDAGDEEIVAWKEALRVAQPIFHPFFTQVAIELMAVVNRVVWSAGIPHFSIPTVGSMGQESLLDVPMSYAFAVVRANELSYLEELRAANLADESRRYDGVRLFVNSWFLYSVFAKEDCRVLGLWPEFAQMATQTMSAQYSPFSVSREVYRAIESVKCGGNLPELDPEWTKAPLHVNDIDVFAEMRRMGVQYGFRFADDMVCVGAPKMFLSENKLHLYCVAEDPAAPSDVRDYEDARKNQLSNPRAVRMKKAQELIEAPRGK